MQNFKFIHLWFLLFIFTSTETIAEEKDNIYKNSSFTILLPSGWKHIPHNINEKELRKHTGWDDSYSLWKYNEVNGIKRNDVIFFKNNPSRDGQLILNSLPAKATQNITNPEWQDQIIKVFKSFYPEYSIKGDSIKLKGFDMYNVVMENERKYNSVFYMIIDNKPFAFNFTCRQSDSACKSDLKNIIENLQV